MDSSWSPNSKTLESDGPQHDRPSAQQLSSVTSLSFCFFKNCLRLKLLQFKLLNWLEGASLMLDTNSALTAETSWVSGVLSALKLLLKEESIRHSSLINMNTVIWSLKFGMCTVRISTGLPVILNIAWIFTVIPDYAETLINLRELPSTFFLIRYLKMSDYWTLLSVIWYTVSVKRQTTNKDPVYEF